MLRHQKVILFHMQEKQTMYKNTALVLEGGGMMFAPGQVDVSDMTEIALPNGMTYYEK